MSRLDELPPDQRAALALLLRQRKSYAEVAALLAIRERAVHDRAHAALALLAPREARELTGERREDVGDYLLGQQAGVAERLETRTYLSAAPPARRWAEAIAAELAPLAVAPLPEIPDGTGPAAPEGREEPVGGSSSGASATGALGKPTPERSIAERLPSSRLGGGLLLAAVAAAVIVAVILITNGGGKSHAVTGARTTTAAAGPKVVAQLALSSPEPGSRTVGAVEVLAEGAKRAFLIDAENLAETKGFFYALWLYNSPTSARGLSSGPPVGKSHRLQGGALLPSDAASFHTILLTRETNRHATRPGPVVLRGPFKLGG